MSNEHERRECAGHLANLIDRRNARLRILSLKERNDLAADRRSVKAARFKTIEARHDNGTAPLAVSSHNLFPTPPPLAARLVDIAGIQALHRVLEPSAGTGRLLDHIHPLALTTACESSQELCGLLFHRYPTIKIKRGDFLARTCADLGGPFDRIVMNPPFQRGEDVRHIMHAYGMLAPGGLLVSLCYDGATQNKKLKPLVTTWEILPPGSFACEGTSAGVVMITMMKP